MEVGNMIFYEPKDFHFNENIMDTVVKNIVKYRKEKGFTQEKLAFYTALPNEFARRVKLLMVKEDTH